MSQNMIYCFSKNKRGHHSDYARIINKILNAKIEISLPQQFLILLLKKAVIIFIDGDEINILFVPFLILRSLCRQRSILINIRSEALIRNNIKNKFKRLLYLFLKLFREIKIVSIHKQYIIDKKINKYFTDFIYDFQYWDLPYLKIGTKVPQEIDSIKIKKPIVLLSGEFNKKKSSQELLNFLQNNPSLNFTFLFGGVLPSKIENIIKNHKSCFLINRYLENEELIYLYNYADYVYCYYSTDTNRPSGIFGRGFQLRKRIIVRKNGYLHKENHNYNGLVPIDNINDLKEILKCNDNNYFNRIELDDVRTLRKLIN